MILSFKSGRPIAKIIDSNVKDLNNKLIRIKEDTKDFVHADILDIKWNLCLRSKVFDFFKNIFHKHIKIYYKIDI